MNINLCLVSSQVVCLKPDEYYKEVMSLDDIEKEFDKLENKLDMLDEPTYDDKYPNITFLGTGSCIPNKGRNVSGILLQSE